MRIIYCKQLYQKYHNVLCDFLDCGLNVHRQCVRVVDENCPGPLVKKERGNASISKLMERISQREPKRKPSSLNLSKLKVDVNKSQTLP